MELSGSTREREEEFRQKIRAEFIVCVKAPGSLLSPETISGILKLGGDARGNSYRSVYRILENPALVPTYAVCLQLADFVDHVLTLRPALLRLVQHWEGGKCAFQFHDLGPTLGYFIDPRLLRVLKNDELSIHEKAEVLLVRILHIHAAAEAAKKEKLDE